VEITSIDPLTEGAMLRTLTRALGQGEAAAIAIAACRGYSVALDDLRARRACDALVPPVSWISTEGILGVAVTEGLLSRREAEQIWTGTGISDPSRFVP
jgi:predicted nucleic acid-binding protein